MKTGNQRTVQSHMHAIFFRLTPRRRTIFAAFAFALLLAARALSPPAAFAQAPITAGDVPPTDVLDTQKSWRPESFTLENGLRVVILPDHRAPVITHMIWYRIGAADEPVGKSGIAHFLEHLMFRGTANVPPGELSKIIARNGGQDNAFTTYDYTAYYQRLSADRLPLAMQLEADRMTGLVLTDDIVLPERDVIIEERSQRTDNDPSSLLGEQVEAALYMNHPYGIPVIGWEHEMRGLTREDAVNFYKTYYTPNNAMLVIAGDVTTDEVKTLTEKYFGPIPAREVPERFRPKEPPHLASIHLAMKDARVKQPTFRRVYLAPTYAGAKDDTPIALDVLMEILGSGSTSRLYRALVVEQGLAVSAGAWYSGAALDYGEAGLYGVPVTGVSLSDLERAGDQVVSNLLENGVTTEELDRAKENLIADTIYQTDSQQSMAYMYGVALSTGLSVDDVMGYPDKVRAVTAEEVIDAARKIFTSPANVTGYLEPAQ